MKTRFIIFSIVLAVLSPAFGQSELTKKVAILETVDKENVVPYGVKLMVRSKLSYAITNTPGYEGYDRVDITSIMNEQEFQRTGLVSDTQIKKLGEMTGADYILIAEVAKLDNSHIIIVSKILNVESARLEQTANIQTATDLDAMENACRELAARLLGVQRGRTITLSESNNSGYSSYSVGNIDKFPIIYSMRNTIECDGVYKGPDWEEEYRNHTKKFHKKLSNNFNTKAFFVECSFSCPNAVPVDDYYENLVLLSFDTGHRRFSIFLSRTGNIIIDTNYGDYTYETNCQYAFNKWNILQVSYNSGKVKIRCNNTSDEFDVVMNEEDWGDNDISSTYWGTMNTYKGLIRDISVGSAPK